MRNNFLICFFILVHTVLNASSVVNINYNSQKIEEFKVGYILDKNNSLSLDSVKSMKFENISNYHSFGNTKSILWTKLTLKNITDIKKKMTLHNDVAYFSKNITIYELKNSKLVNQTMHNILDNKEDNKLVGSTLIYPFELQPRSTTIFYIKTEPMLMQISKLNIYDDRRHNEALVKKTFLPSAIVSILLALSAYSLVLFSYHKRKEFMCYAIYFINISLGLAYMYGLVFDFGLYGEQTHWLSLTNILVSLFLAIFIKSIFNFKDTNPSMDKTLNSVIYLSGLNFLIAFIDLQLALKLMPYVYAYSFIAILYIGYVPYAGHMLSQDKKSLFLMFANAYIVYIIGFTLTTLSLLGFIPLNAYTFYASGVSLILEALLFSYLLKSNVKIQEDIQALQASKLLVKTQKEQMGDIISTITHQWKQPLNTISSIVMLLQYKLDDGDCEAKYLKDKLLKIDTSLHFIDSTLNDFRQFFSTDDDRTDCDLEVLINKAIALSKDDTLANQIIITTDLQFTKTVHLVKSEILHILLNILQNSKEIFKDLNIPQEHTKMIKVIGRTKEDASYIDIIDNAGGISQEKLPYIFQKDYRKEEKNKNNGLGLYLSKIILETHMNGTIEAKNIGDGTMFRIKL